jgi:hypothetical protein
MVGSLGAADDGLLKKPVSRASAEAISDDSWDTTTDTQGPPSIRWTRKFLVEVSWRASFRSITYTDSHLGRSQPEPLRARYRWKVIVRTCK